MADDNDNNNDDLIDDAPVVNDDDQSNQNDDDQQSAKTTSTTDPELLKAVQALGEKIGKQDEPKEKELTEEEKKELWAVYEPDDDTIKDFFGLEGDVSPELMERKRKAFAKVQAGLMRQAVTGARNLHSIDFEKFKGEFTPVREYVTKAQLRESRETFTETYPALAAKEFEPVIKVIEKRLKREDFKSEEEYFKVLAEDTAEAIKAVKPDFDLGATKQKPKPAGTSLKLPRSSVGGTGGTGGGSAAADKSGRKNAVDELV